MKLLAKAKAKLINLAGFETDRELGTGSPEMSSVVFDALGNPGDWSSLFCYRSFEPETGIFLNKDDGIGFVLEIAPLVGVDGKIVKNLQHFFDKEMPDKTFLQFTLIASQKIGNILNLWKKMRVSDDPFLRKISAKRLEYMTSLAEDYVTSGIKTARDYRIIISFNSTALGRTKVINFKRQLLKKLKVLSLEPATIGAQSLIDLTDEIMAQKSDINQRGNKLNQLMPLNEQAVKYGKSIEIREEEIQSGDTVTKTYGVEEYPGSWSLMDMIQLLGDNGNKGSLLTIPARFIINFTVASDMPKGSNERLVARAEQVRKTSEQFLSRFDENLKREAAEWAEIMGELKEGRRVLGSSFTVAITAPKSVIEDAEAALVSLYNQHGWELTRSDNIHLPMMQAIMPMQASYMWQAMRFMKQRNLLLSNELVAKLPLHAEWRGNPISGVLFQAGRGQLFNWNPFYKIAGGNYNCQILGPSGVGKSVLIQEITTTMLSQGVKMFIVDIGESYKNICRYKEGEYIQFIPGSNISLNPFSGLADSTGILRKAVLEDGSPIPIKTIRKGDIEYDLSIDGVTNAKNILAVMCGVAGDAHKEALIEGAIYAAVLEYGAKFNITDLAELLKRSSKLEVILGETLLPFTDNGVYGDYFNKESNITFKKQITVFELEQIASDKTLLAVVMQVIAMQIFKQVLCSDRSQKFMMCLDECWRVLDSNAKSVAEYTRTFRKYGASVVTCVQNVSDLDGSEDRKTIAQNSEWTIMLEQNDKGLKALQGSAYEDLAPLIESITFVKGSHSEMLLLSSRVTIIAKLLLDPYASALYSTDNDDFKYLNSLIARGINLNDALEALIEHKQAS